MMPSRSDLRKQRLGQSRRTPLAAPVPVVGPYGGLNTRDALDSMELTDAVVMDNFFPGEGDITIRGGKAEVFDSNEQTAIESLHEYHAGTTRQLIAGVDGRLYDLTAAVTGTTDGTTASHLIHGGVDFAAAGVATNSIVQNTDDGTYANVTVVALGDLTLSADIFVSGENYSIQTPIGTGFSDDDWDAINFDDELILVNSNTADRAKRWDGTTLSNSAWTGPSPDDGIFSGVHVHKERLFYWTGRDADFWYADNVYAKTGTIVKFPLSRVGSFGGVLIAMETWTMDAGAGKDDFAVFLMSSGTVIVYEGVDPGNSTLWGLVGIYETAEPVGGHEAMVKMGPDVFINTKEDIVPLTKVMREGYTGNRSKISGAIQTAFNSAGDVFGWQMMLAPEGRRLYVNYPSTVADTYFQYVMNTITGAWCRFKDLPAACWGRYNGTTMFGGTDGIVYNLSADSDDGTAIDGIVQQAWSDFGSPYEKNPVICRPVLSADGDINYDFAVGFDFVPATPSSPASASSTGATWDVAEWDVTDWTSEYLVYTGWSPCSGKGQMVSSTLRVSAKQRIAWLRTDFRAKMGDRL